MITSSSSTEGGRKQIRIMLADDHQIVRQGLRSMLEHNPDIAVVGEAADGRAVVEMALQLKPDVVVMDIGMPQLNGIDATRQLISQLPHTNVVALSMHTDRRFIVEIFKAGAKGYVVKDSAFHELAAAVRAVVGKRVYLSPRIAGEVMDNVASETPLDESSAFSRLSGRQREVLQLIAEGKTTKEIAYQLGLCVKTVETHRARMMESLNLFTVADLTRYAIREGVSGLEK
jgi:DNA-binding NarL/FixJ family response regulator